MECNTRTLLNEDLVDTHGIYALVQSRDDIGAPFHITDPISSIL